MKRKAFYLDPSLPKKKRQAQSREIEILGFVYVGFELMAVVVRTQDYREGTKTGYDLIPTRLIIDLNLTTESP